MAPLPIRLVELVEELNSEYSGFSHEQEQRLAQACAAGEPAVDLVYHLPSTVGPAARHLRDLLTEADEYCQAGNYLLTLAAPGDVVRFRNWFLDEFINQVANQAPTPWTR